MENCRCVYDHFLPYQFGYAIASYATTARWTAITMRFCMAISQVFPDITPLLSLSNKKSTLKIVQLAVFSYPTTSLPD